MDVKIPFLGDGINSANVLSVAVTVGDAVKKDQTILELETDKAVAPIPAPANGTVEKILVQAGSVVSVGTPVLVLAGAASANDSQAKNSAPPQPVPAQILAAPLGQQPYVSTSNFPPPAAPSLRQMAQQLGLDLTRVRGSARGGRITLADVRNYVQQIQSASVPTGSPAAGARLPSAASMAAGTPVPVVDFSKFGAVAKKPLSSLRKKIGAKMHEAWVAIPHVTQNDVADITRLMTLRKKYRARYEKKAAALTLTVLLIRPVAAALKKFPRINASVDWMSGELIVKEYIHLGLAVDTDSGLMVPVIRDADKKSVLQLALELGSLAEKARTRKIALEDLQGGSFTISNLGGFGVGHFTPIINAPELAILGVGGGRLMSVAQGKKMSSRLLLPLSLSYDHRVVDGADGARFIREIVAQIETIKEAELRI